MRALRRAIVSLIACFSLLVGCLSHRCPPPPPRLALGGLPIIDVTVYVAPEFTERERANIVNGILMWERATNGLVTWRMLAYDTTHPPKPGGSHGGIQERTVMFKRVTSTEDWVVKWDADHKDRWLLGMCDGDSLKDLALLWLVEDRLATPQAEKIIAAHEFGHALGLNEHVSDKASVMSEMRNPSVTCLTAHDLKEFCRIHGCDATLAASCPQAAIEQLGDAG